MFVGNTCYVDAPFSDERFRFMLEKHLEKNNKGDPLSKSLIQECIAAMLECEAKNENYNSIVNTMEKILDNLGISYIDYRKFSKEDKKSEIALDAVKCFVYLEQSYLLKKRKDEFEKE